MNVLILRIFEEFFHGVFWYPFFILNEVYSWREKSVTSAVTYLTSRIILYHKASWKKIIERIAESGHSESGRVGLGWDLGLPRSLKMMVRQMKADQEWEAFG